MTSYYFQPQESVHYRFGDDDRAILRVLADRYIGANPPVPFMFRTFHRSGVLQAKDGLYDLNLAAKFPDAEYGHYAYAYTWVWSDSERNLDLLLRCCGPVQLYFNEERLYRSSVIDEIKPDAEVKLNVTFAKGWNRLFIKAMNTPAGFGCQLGADEAKVRILNVLSPFPERSGQAGWIYSEPAAQDCFPNGPDYDRLQTESASGLSWFPKTQWEQEQEGQPTLERLFGRQAGKHAYAWTKLWKRTAGEEAVVLEGRAAGPLTVWFDGRLAVHLPGGGPFRQQLSAGAGKHNVLVRSQCADGQPWDFVLTASAGGANSEMVLPVAAAGAPDSPWLFVGPFEPGAAFQPADMTRTDRVYPLTGHPGQPDQLHEAGERAYWRLDAPDAWLRPYYENAMLSNKWTVGSVTNYARWDYPLGVTIYGLLQTGRLLNRPDIVSYAVDHVGVCTEMHEYSLWDRDTYGFPALNQQLVLMKMLDNCGSFGSAMLEAHMESGDPHDLPIAERIADFMLRRLERREDGAFYRRCEGEYAADTMWADDLYMSTPFLCRYARLTENSEALDEAARQFLRFRSYLYMPDQQIMSHVYDFKYDRQTGIPWGRGNGWTLFSLSEVLEALPHHHKARPELVAFFNDLCEGYAALQAESGLWHQVLNDPDAYEEASCTAMFAYGFARGVRLGWLNEPNRFILAAQRAWEGLTRCAIDRQGNVHGVCSGSRYAFTRDYYKYDLLTVTNDNHGIGIMLLAGTEIAKLKQWLEQTPAAGG